MSEMADRVARALFPHVFEAGLGDHLTPEAIEAAQEYARLKARLAIHAMFIPTDAMVTVGLEALVASISADEERLGPAETDEQRHMSLGARMRSSREVVACWRAMVGEAVA